jgi:hypothetical protein
LKVALSPEVVIKPPRPKKQKNEESQDEGE